MQEISSENSDRSERLPPEHPSGIRRVQVGCGPHHLRPTWWNTDLREFRGIDEAMDATAPWRWKDQLEFVFAEHFVEHLPIEGCMQFLVHAGNALQPGGRIRLSTPNLEWVMRTHFSFTPENLPSRLMDTFNINRAFHGWGHQFLYSKEMLQELLKQAGYKRIQLFKYGESDTPELRGLELHGPGPVFEGHAGEIIIEGERGIEPLSITDWVKHWLHNNYTQWSYAEH
ncbi:methyltransferase domain-containing protein [Labrys neptuniae]